MAKGRKWTLEERAERLKRERDFRELLEKRQAVDERLEHERREREENAGAR